MWQQGIKLTAAAVFAGLMMAVQTLGAGATVVNTGSEDCCCCSIEVVGSSEKMQTSDCPCPPAVCASAPLPVAIPIPLLSPQQPAASLAAWGLWDERAFQRVETPLAPPPQS